jgi:hypothetical protein
MTTKVNALPVTHGTVGGTPITSNVASDDLATTRYVTLSSNYVRNCPLGYPNPHPGFGAQKSPTAYPQTILSGTRALFFAGEAAALVAAGAGAYS